MSNEQVMNTRTCVCGRTVSVLCLVPWIELEEGVDANEVWKGVHSNIIRCPQDKTLPPPAFFPIAFM